MCDFGKPHHHQQDFGFLVDVPEVRALVEQTQRLTHEITDTAERVDALRPAFAALLAADNWLPWEYSEPDLKSGMSSGIGQYALYRAEDRSLALFSLVIPAGAETPIHDHLAWGLIGVYRGAQDETVYRRLDNGEDESKARLEVARRQTVRTIGNISGVSVNITPLLRPSAHQPRVSAEFPGTRSGILKANSGHVPVILRYCRNNAQV